MAARIVNRELTADVLRELLSYCPDTGVFVWRTSCQGTKAGDIAGASGSEGRRHICINYTRHKAHRLAWLYVNGEWPKGLIDHINGIPYDNRIANLREATMSENLCNQRRAHKNNSTGLLGARQCGVNKFSAQIAIGGKITWLGTFNTAELAHEAYVSAKKKLHKFAPK